MNLTKHVTRYGLLGMLVLSLAACKPDTPNGSAGQVLPAEHDYDLAAYKWGYADPNGRLIIENNFDETRPFSQGLAVVRLADQRMVFWWNLPESPLSVVPRKPP